MKPNIANKKAIFDSAANNITNYNIHIFNMCVY